MTSFTIGTFDGTLLVTAPFDNGAASGDVTIIAGIAHKIIRVYRLAIVIAAATNVIFKEGATALSGPMDFSTIGSITLDQSGLPWYICESGNSFVINSSNAVQIGGTIWYTQQPENTV